MGGEAVIVPPPCPDNPLPELFRVNVGVNKHTRSIPRQLTLAEILCRKLSEVQVRETVNSEVECGQTIVKLKLAPPDCVHV